MAEAGTGGHLHNIGVVLRHNPAAAPSTQKLSTSLPHLRSALGGLSECGLLGYYQCGQDDYNRQTNVVRLFGA